jgi:hypothetical protein
MPDLTTQMSPCKECERFKERYASATSKREWAKADLLAALSSGNADALKTAQVEKAEAVREWEAARAALEAHLKTERHTS